MKNVIRKTLIAFLSLVIALGGLTDFTPETAHAATYDDFWVVAVAGGGGGGDAGTGRSGGGGGAGEYLEDTTYSLDESTSYTITIGAGGAGNSGNTAGSNGTDTSITAVFTLDGGGGGGGFSLGGQDGGSGGGAPGGSSIPNTTEGVSTASDGVGNNGGEGNNDGTISETAAGGGGGASTAGSNGTPINQPGVGGSGGTGIDSSITGSSVGRGGGGGGGGGGTTAGTATDGGGAGGANSNQGSPGTANTGGGGGGSHWSDNANGDGGSGVVIIRFATADITVLDDTGATETTDGSDTILTYNTSGTFEFELSGGGPSDSCTYTSGDWNVLYSDNCYITSNETVTGACNFIYDGAGSFALSAEISCGQGVNGSDGFIIQGTNDTAKIYIAQ